MESEVHGVVYLCEWLLVSGLFAGSLMIASWMVDEENEGEKGKRKREKFFQTRELGRRRDKSLL